MFIRPSFAVFLSSLATMALATTLGDLCTSTNVANSLPAIEGITFGVASAAAVYNHSVAATNNYPAIDGRDFCNVTVAYTHTSKNDSVRATIGWDINCFIRLTHADRSTFITTCLLLRNGQTVFSQLVALPTKSIRVSAPSKQVSSTTARLVLRTVDLVVSKSHSLTLSFPPMAQWTSIFSQTLHISPFTR